MDETIALKLLNEFRTPKHIIKHCELVGRVGKKIAEEYVKKGINVDMESVFIACLLHDSLRIVDIFDNNYKEFAKTQNKEDTKVWDKLREKYKNIEHPEAIYQVLSKKGYEKIALMIRKHGFEDIIDNPPRTLEEKIVTYADKRVLHTSIVSMKERFEDGHKRYNSVGILSEREQEIHKAYFHLEKELFNAIDLEPEDIDNETFL